MTTLLAITTVGAPGGICLHRTEGLVERSFELRGTRYSQVLLSEIHQLLKDEGLTVEDLDAIAVCTGPGSFTGIRVGMAIARGLAYANQIPIVGVRAFEALAHVHKREDVGLGLLLDARRGEVYACFSAPGEGLEGLPLAALSPEEVKAQLIERSQDYPLVLAGDACPLYGDQWIDIDGVTASDRGIQTVSPRAVAELGLVEIIEKGAEGTLNEVLPVYIRRAV